MDIKIKRKFGKNAMSEVKYPNQIFSVVKENSSGVKTTFSVNAMLAAMEDADGITPGEIHQHGLSRFAISIVRIEDTVKTVNANIPVSEIPLLKNELNYALRVLSEFARQPSGSDDSTDIPTLKFGPFKGKTPHEVLSENASNKEALENTKKILEGNVAQYPVNQILIDAINDALDKLSKGQLGKECKSKTFKVWESGIKVPNAGKKRTDGRTLVYTVNIMCNPTKDLAFSFEIMNCYCFVPSAGSVDFSSSQDKTVLSVSLDKGQVCTLLANIDRRLLVFDVLHAKEAESLENKYSYHQKDLSEIFDIDDAVIEKIVDMIAKKLNKESPVPKERP